ncbi:GPI mannosyltransferase 2 [Phlyctochytrium arcticum]|nr:GPI mannosyltransferase 2 [Phlyctochytrium arcticum]
MLRHRRDQPSGTNASSKEAKDTKTGNIDEPRRSPDKLDAKLGQRQLRVLTTAIASRLFYCVLAVLVGSTTSPYDLSNVTNSWRDATGPTSRSKLEAFLMPFVRWDAVYFLDIAERGYTSEQQFAFQSGLPEAMNLLAACMSPSLTKRSRLMLAGVLISNASFIFAALMLYKLGVKIVRNERIAYSAAILYCFTAAGMFMSAIYTESPFACLTFIGMYFAAKGHESLLWYLLAAVSWTLATRFRANGVVYAGYFLWYLVLDPIFQRQWTNDRAKRLLEAGLGFVLASFPLLQFYSNQLDAYRLFCTPGTFNGHTSESRPWCFKAIPSIYSYVQEAYWDNGFLRYWKLKQLPNFILAAPMLGISIAGIAVYYRADPRRFLTLGFLSRPRDLEQKHGVRSTLLSERLLPHVYLWACLTLLLLTTMHVQIITRFFTCIPCLYWFTAYFAQGGKLDGTFSGENRFRYFIWYFLGYGFSTGVLFASFLPPA